MATLWIARLRAVALLFTVFCVPAVARDAAPPPQTPLPGQVLVSGTVPDEATKAAILARLKEIHGAAKVVDQIAVGSVALPANWNDHVRRILQPALQSVARGQLHIEGTAITLRGEVQSEEARQQVVRDLANGLGKDYVLQNRLSVAASDQSLLDQALADRIIEFNSAQADLTPSGKAVLDDMVPTLLKLSSRTVEVIGHTDNSGLRTSNIALSKARAETVRRYLADRGIDPARITTVGLGPDQPVATNDTVEGRSRNRRIEFRIVR